MLDFFVKLGYIWYLDILWLVTSLPIFTIGASTTALLYSSMKLQKEEGYPTKNFFHSFKENFKQATGIWMIYLGVGALLALDLIYWNKRGAGFSNLNMPWALSIAACILYGISLSYVFAIQSKFVNTVRNTILYSILLPYRNLKQTILIAIVLIAVIYFNVTTVYAVNFMTLNFGVGLIAYLFGVFYSDVFEKYIPKEKEDGESEEET